MEHITLYNNLSTHLSKEKKLSLLVIVLLELTFSSNNTVFNQIIDYLTKSKILDDSINTYEYTNAKTNLLNLISNLNLSNSITSNIYNKTFEEIEELGLGGFGNVYKVKHKIDETKYAIKKIPITSDLVEDNYDVFQEVKLLSRLNHPNIVKYFSSWVDVDLDLINKLGLDNSQSLSLTPIQITKLNTNPNLTLGSIPVLYIQMELCDYTLKDLLEKDEWLDLDVEHRVNYWLQLVEGLKYIHINSIIHRDIKPSNIFITNNQLKIGDFGLSKKISFDNLDSKSIDIGFAYYKAPEIEYSTYNYKIDIYSIGIILLEMMLNCKTLYEKSITINKIVQTDSLDQNCPLITTKYNDLILKLIDPNPDRRIELNDIFKYF